MEPPPSITPRRTAGRAHVWLIHGGAPQALRRLAAYSRDVLVKSLTVCEVSSCLGLHVAPVVMFKGGLWFELFKVRTRCTPLSVFISGRVSTYMWVETE